jgi:hypothetical protein
MIATLIPSSPKVVNKYCNTLNTPHIAKIYARKTHLVTNPCVCNVGKKYEAYVNNANNKKECVCSTGRNPLQGR